MHSYLRSIGFKDIGQKELEQIYQETKIAPDRVQEIVDSEGYAFAEIRKEILPGIGIAFRGNMDEAGEFVIEVLLQIAEIVIHMGQVGFPFLHVGGKGETLTLLRHLLAN